MAVINTGMVPKAMSGGAGMRRSSKAVRSQLACHNDGGPAFVPPEQANAYGPPVQQASAPAQPISDVLAHVERARQQADEAFR